ncbi:hypothetical protein SAPIO_CDS0640 [Scedosporium apiospermum]|uniref:Rab-GAP TBC domain-containing protein n=1 Tax=Pseudallescheria apiosperma TaxID=563466 RepID=A0A084GG75_PSEDA|nr:uncharacterized protein SAPIO_CDS0640 [Scedosporium apiospermum]KEZ46337.1 hypothetical protein SAPIO_CDS0640 [Scedosporium apiospermum]
MTTSRSSSHKSHLDDDGVLSDVRNFEDISLDDAAATAAPVHNNPSVSARRPLTRDNHLKVTIPKQPHASPVYQSDGHGAHAGQRNLSTTRTLTRTRDVSQKFLPQRDTSSGLANRARQDPPSPQSPGRLSNGRSVSAHGSLDPPPRSPSFRRLPIQPSLTAPNLLPRQRSPSPNFLLGPKDPNQILRPRRSSWQSNRERKTILELEREFDDDEDDDDDIPDGLILDNVPISPRPTSERPKSQPQSPLLLPHGLSLSSKDRRSVGNGTPAVATAQGSLRSPTWKSDTALADCNGTEHNFPSQFNGQAKGRAKSWNIAMASLSPEMKALTEKLEEHSDELDEKTRSSHEKRPATWDVSRQAFDPVNWKPKLRKHSQLPELPPLRRNNVMIDPLPISKEKEAVLSRTRPSWLPPKDPAEEKRHLRQYKQMMAQSAEADRRKEATRSAIKTHRDNAADNLMRIWEEEVIPRWGHATREPRTRELWWKGIPPRSRGVVWSKAIGNELGLSELSYTAALKRAQDAEERIKADKGDPEDTRRAAWFEAIRKDVAEKTWPDLRIFQEGGPLHESLTDVLSAYAMYRGDIGYVSGCNSIAALLLLNLPNATDTFIALANVLNRPIPLSFYAGDPGAKSSAYNLVVQTLKDKSPALHQHITSKIPDPEPDAYLSGIFTTLFTASLAVDEAARLWDVYVFEGDAVLIRAAVALIVWEEGPLLGAASVEDVRAVLGGGGASTRQKKVLGEVGAEDRWMQAVREAGKA